MRLNEMAVWSKDKKKLQDVLKQSRFILKHLNILLNQQEVEMGRAYKHSWPARQQAEKDGDVVKHTFPAAVLSFAVDVHNAAKSNVSFPEDINVWKYSDDEELILAFWNRLNTLWRTYFRDMGGDRRKIQKMLHQKVGDDLDRVFNK